MVVKNWNGVNEMSVINLDDPDVTCETLDTGPLRTLISAQSIHATFVGGELMVCGAGPSTATSTTTRRGSGSTG